MVDIAFVNKHIAKVFGALAFIVNPIFVYLIFTESKVKFGNYRYLLLYFATFNLIFSFVNVLVPIDIHSFRYCFYMFLTEGFFFDQSDVNLHILALRCSVVSASYAVLLSHFIYRYLVIHNSSFTTRSFHIYMTISFGVLLAYYAAWHSCCYLLASANLEARKYIRSDFQHFYNKDSMQMNMIACLYREGSDDTLLRSWSATSIYMSISAITICVFLCLARMILKKLRSMGRRMSQKSSNLQIELLRALIVQSVIPIFVSFLPCAFSFVIPIFNLDLGRPINYVEVIALGAFPFCDPVAIVMCLPVFRRRVLCRNKKPIKKNIQMNLGGTTT